MNDVKAILFDCFGVLYPQASGDFFENHQELFESRDVLDELNLQIDLGKIDRAGFFSRLEAITGIPTEKIQTEMDQELKPDEKLVSLIQRLKSRYKIGLLSNAGKEEIDIVFRDKIDNLFDSMAISYEVGVVKPQAEIFTTCCKRIGVSLGQCLFVDDSEVNLEAAEKLGMKALYYPVFGNIPDELLRLASFR